MLSKRIGIDLGTGTLRIHVKGEGIVVSEPSLAAVEVVEGGRVVAFGRQAVEMAREHPRTIRLARPAGGDGALDLALVEAMLRHFVGALQGRQRLFRPEVLLAVSTAISGAERRALTEAAIMAGARQAWLLDEPLAVAIGAGLKIDDASPHAVCDIGGGRTELAVIARSGIVAARSLGVGGNSMDEAIAAHLERRHGLVLDPEEAERVKLAVGSAVLLEEQPTVEVSGRDIGSGTARSLRLGSQEVTAALGEPLEAIVAAVRGVVDDTPAGMAAQVRERGLLLSGGGALLRGVDHFVAAAAGMPVSLPEDPQTCVVRGTGQALEAFEVLRRNQPYLG